MGIIADDMVKELGVIANDSIKELDVIADDNVKELEFLLMTEFIEQCLQSPLIFAICSCTFISKGFGLKCITFPCAFKQWFTVW